MTQKARFTYKTMDEVVPTDMQNYLCILSKEVVSSVPLSFSKAVAFDYKRTGNLVTTSADPAQSQQSARVNKKTGKTLDRGIQLYRLWFNFLKLGIELESQSVSLVVKNPTVITNLNNPNEPIPQELIEKARHTGRGGRQGEASGSERVFRCRLHRKVRVNKNRYAGWDLDQVLTQSFDKWWKSHSHLFEGYYPSIVQNKDEWIEDSNFVYVRVDKTSRWMDVQQFMREELSKLVKEDGRPRYKISGKNPRVNVIQNNFNALVLSIQGWTPKEICTHEKIFLRKTDEHFDSQRTQGHRLTIKTQNGQPKYSATVSAQRAMGIHHLFEVCEGRFGIAPPTKIKAGR